MKMLFGIVVLSLCGGCSTPEPSSGNITGAHSAELVRDAVSVMLEVYPPARTRLALVRKADDGFGNGLTEELRLRGYAVAEYVEPEKKGWGAKKVAKPDGLPFAYLIAGTGVENELRVIIHVEGESLSRLYGVAGEGGETHYTPLGAWSRRVSVGEKDKPTA